MFLLHLFQRWTWQMAWRDARRDWKRLLVFSVSIMFGIAALVAIGSLKENLVEAVNLQAKALVGSDAFVNARGKFSPTMLKLLEQSGAEMAREISCVGTMRFPTGRPEVDSLRVEGRAVEPGFPFYGTPVTEPPDAWARCIAGDGFVTDRSLAEQAGIQPNDKVKFGALELPFLGTFVIPPARAGWTGAFGVVAPEVFYARRHAEATGLTTGLLFVSERVHMKFPDTSAAEAWAGPNRDAIRKAGGDVETVERRRKNIGNVLDHLYSFLSLLGFIALILGGLGIASAIHIHAQQRLSRVGTLRCLGCSSAKIFAIFLAQGICLGLVGSTGGVLLGLALQKGIPALFQHYIIIKIDLAFQPGSILLAQGLGFLICISFTLLPLLKVRRVSPLAAVRATIAEERPKSSWALTTLLWLGWIGLGAMFIFFPMAESWSRTLVQGLRSLGIARASRDDVVNLLMITHLVIGCGLLVRARDVYWWFILAILAVTLIWLAYSLSPPKNPKIGSGFAVGLALGLLVLAMIGKGIIWLARKIVSRHWPYTFRQGLLNLHRPRNQTILFLLSAGLGVSLILTMILARDLLLTTLETKALKDKPNLLLLNVKPEQRADVEAALLAHGAADPEFAPLVPMRLVKVKGVTLEKLAENPQTKIDGWIHGHEFRATYRDHLTKAETLTAGTLTTKYDGSPVLPVSLEKGLAERLRVGLGDELTFRVAGTERQVRITSIREVKWGDLGINFFCVFPPGAIDEATQMTLMSGRQHDPVKAAILSKAVASQFPNVSVFDLGEVVTMIGEILEKIAFVIKFMAMFTVITGVVILGAVLASGKRDRIEESVLLRTLGASRGQIWRILVSEYLLLGFFSALAGGILSHFAAGWLALNVFNVPEAISWKPGAWTIAIVCAFTTLLGVLLSRGITAEPPLRILRES